MGPPTATIRSVSARSGRPTGRGRRRPIQRHRDQPKPGILQHHYVLAELIDGAGKVITGYDREGCQLQGPLDQLRHPLRWCGNDGSDLACERVRVCIYLCGSAVYALSSPMPRATTAAMPRELIAPPASRSRSATTSVSRGAAGGPVRRPAHRVPDPRLTPPLLLRQQSSRDEAGGDPGGYCSPEQMAVSLELAASER